MKKENEKIDVDALCELNRDNVVDWLREQSLGDLKRILCDVLDVSSYHAYEELITKLTKVAEEV